MISDFKRRFKPESSISIRKLYYQVFQFKIK